LCSFLTVSLRSFEPMAALLARNPLRIHPETFHFL